MTTSHDEVSIVASSHIWVFCLQETLANTPHPPPARKRCTDGHFRPVNSNCKSRVSITEKQHLQVTLSGKDFAYYDLSLRGDAIVSNNDELRLQFRTRQSTGLLLYTGRTAGPRCLAISILGVTTGECVR